MAIKSLAARIWASQLVPRTYRQAQHAVETQQQLLRTLTHAARFTEFGKAHGFQDIQTPEAFRTQVPLRTYEELLPWIERILAGKPDVLWPGHPIYLATTSGTTAGAKYIPITRDSIPFHIQSARDALLFYVYHSGKTDFVNGRMTFLSGSPELETHTSGIPLGRLSGIAHHYVPSYLTRNRLPSFAVNCIDDWETKVERMLDESLASDLRLLSGIPPWVQMYLERVRARTGRAPAEIWPHLQVYVHGGVDFRPYQHLILEALGRPVDLVETYPASEGFIAFQDDYRAEGLLLRFNQGMYFEFVPLNEVGKADAPRLHLGQVQLDQQYAIVLNTNSGLWGYVIGDTVRFVSLNPPRIKVTGRIKHFISAFGEHVIQEEVNQALTQACKACPAVVTEFTVAPKIGENHSCHEWWIEFEVPPADEIAFGQHLDQAMREQNKYYDDLRTGGMMGQAQVIRLRPQACRDYMKSIGKLGGQNKFPRLTNDRKLVDALMPYRQ